MIASSIVPLARIGNITTSHVWIKYISGITSASVTAAQTLRLTDMLATSIPYFAHVCGNASSFISVQFISFITGAMIAAINVDAIVSAPTVVLSTFVIINANPLILSKMKSCPTLAHETTKSVTTHLAAPAIVRRAFV